MLLQIAGYKPLHFVVAGALLYLLLKPVAGRHELTEPLVLRPAQIQALRDGWQASMGRPPDQRELRGLEHAELDDEMLLREALLHSLHLLDQVVKQRLVMNMRFLDNGSSASDEVLFRQALDLGMERNDVVVRRRLVQVMQMSLQDAADDAPPGAAELTSMYEKRRDEFTVAARWRIEHVYFSGDRRGADAEPDTAAALRKLQAGTFAFAEAQRMGDPFLGGHQLPLLGTMQLAGQFGSAFADSVVACPLQRWCGPLVSSYGLHLVWIEQFVPSRVPEISDPEVHKRLVADVLRERGERLLEQALVSLRKKYGVQS